MLDHSPAPTTERVTPARGRLLLQIGEFVRSEDQVYRITELLGLTAVVGVNVNTKQAAHLKIAALEPVLSEQHDQSELDLSSVSDKTWEEAMRRYAAIAPFIGREVAGAAAMTARAEEVGVNLATLYRWRRLFQARGSVTALISRKRGWQQGQTRLSERVEQVLEEVIRGHYLTKQRPSVKKTIDQVRLRCLKLGLQPPSSGTIHTRVSQLSEEEVLRGRGQVKKARDKFRPVPGTHPGGAYPLDVVQADHTVLDIIVVDERHRKPIGRPSLTLLVCLYSRMITGYYLSLDPPSETSIGLAMAQSILPKEDWLSAHDVKGEWPVWGFPRMLQVDNGADFRSNSLQLATQGNGITLEFCPVRLPNYKGAVERLYRTINAEMHDLPGTTFSNTQERSEYDANKEAALTLAELERWLLNWICNVYHCTPHRALVIAPLSRWIIGVHGDEEEAGIGLPALPINRQTVTLDFMPFKRRTVQHNGVELFGLQYDAAVLKSWIARQNPTTESKLFIFKYDPRDISRIWFYDPVIKDYFEVPLADQRQPAISLFELKRAKTLLKARGRKLKDASEEVLFAAVGEGRQLVDNARASSTVARRDAQRSVAHKRKMNPADPLQQARLTPPPPVASTASPLEDEVKTFGGVA